MNPLLIALGSVGPIGCGLKLFRYWHGVDGALARLHDEHHEIWVALGSPTGWQWAPAARFATPASMCTECFDWRDGQEPGWLDALSPDLATEIRDLRNQGRFLPGWICVGFVGGLLVMLGMAA